MNAELCFMLLLYYVSVFLSEVFPLLVQYFEEWIRQLLHLDSKHTQDKKS